jgi:hypothetical protein
MDRLEDRYDPYSVGRRGLLAIFSPDHSRQDPRLAHRVRRIQDERRQDCRAHKPMSFSKFNLTTAFQQLLHQ